MEKVIRFIIVLLLGFGTWLILSLDTSLVSIAFGSFFALLTAFFIIKFSYSSSARSREGIFIRLDLLILYAVLLLVQSYLSTFQLIKMMLKGDYKPGIVRIKTKVHSDLGKTILANTITLIPGTLSLWVKDDHIYVHWFHQTTTNTIKARRAITGPFEQLAKRIFG